MLSRLPTQEVEKIRANSTEVRLSRGQLIYEPGQIIEQVFFIRKGFASTLVDKGAKAGGVEVGLIGHDSLVGLEVVTSDQARSYGSVVMQEPGLGLVLSAVTLRLMLPELPALGQALMLELAVRLVRLEQSVTCNTRHGVKERLARWLLAAHDRSSTRSLPITQDTLSGLLAVGRSSVNMALGELFDAGVVRGWRGHLTVCDRPALEALSCDCYRRTEEFVVLLRRR